MIPVGAPAATTLSGHYIYSGTTETQLATACASDFVIVKASEGVTYVNPERDRQVQRVRDAGKLVGHYHYARPETNGPDAEARAFLAAVRPRPGDVFALDFEPPSIMPTYPAWATAFGQTVNAATGASCWFYTNQSQGKAMVTLAGPEQRTVLFAMPLWKAYYQATPGDLMGWPEITCWQRGGTFDVPETFYGDAARWRSLGLPEATMALTPDDKKAIADIVDDRLKSFFYQSGAAGTPNGEGYDRVIQASNKSIEQSVSKIAKANADEQYRRQES